MATYYLAPTTWRQDEYRDVIDAATAQQQYDLFAADCAECEWKSPEDAINDCDPLNADNLRDACIEAHEMEPDNLNPEAATGYGEFAPLW